MSSLKSIIDDVDTHLTQVRSMTKEQNQSVGDLMKKNKQNIEAFSAFVDAKNISEKVTQTMKDINDELDSSMKDIEQKLQAIQPKK
ncbi:hypothetical protein A9Q99_22495 [Gammaproteobacteria bacterium 45_16_T64]|nr:hypothetical protein A9Q99_22495 [Gammaproteobacteria bacterium 45_16_T64]